MRVLVCAWDFPYPPRGGGRGDVWRRITAFMKLGHEVMLLNLYDPEGPRRPSQESLDYVDSVLTARYSFAIKRGVARTVRQLLNLARVPWHVATRVPDPREQEEIESVVDDFAPDLIWLDGPWFGELGLALQERLGVPLAYRSHNVEHLYLRRQAGAAKRMRDRIAWRLATVGLKRYQLRLMAAASTVFDISLHDLEYWRGLGVENGSWLPPLPELAVSEPSAERVATDVLFVGGLRTPNNVQGVRWLVSEVLPLVRAERPDIVFGIVGSYPEPDLVRELSGVPGVQTYYDVPDITPYQFGASVLVNPVAVGSGVQLKMLDMLMTDAPAVTRTQGLSGLPEEWAAQFEVADTPKAFADAVLRGVDGALIDADARANLRQQFGVESVRQALTRLSA